MFGNGSDNVYITISNTTTSDNGTWSCVVNNGVLTPLVVNIVLYIVGKLFKYMCYPTLIVLAFSSTTH